MFELLVHGLSNFRGLPFRVTHYCYSEQTLLETRPDLLTAHEAQMPLPHDYSSQTIRKHSQHMCGFLYP